MTATVVRREAEHEEARWHHVIRAAKLRLQISVTIRDLDDLLADVRSGRVITVGDLSTIRRRLQGGLDADREGS